MARKRTKKSELEQAENDELETLSANDRELDGIEELEAVFAAWEFPEYEKHDRPRIWYFAFTVILVGLIAYAVLSGNPLFAVVLILFSIVYISVERRKPGRIDFAISEDGIFINNRHLEFEDLSSFYIVYFPPRIKNLYLQPKNSFRSAIQIPLEDQNPVEIRQILLQFLSEDLEKEEIPTSEGLSRILKL